MKLSRAGFTRPGIAAALELMVNASVRIPAQTSAGRFGCLVIQGTLALPELARPEMMAFWAAVGRRIEVEVRRGTAFCESCRKPSKETKQEGLIFPYGKANCSSELLTVERILDRRGYGIGQRRIKGLPLRECRAKREWVARIHSIVAEKSVEAPVGHITSGFRDDVDESSACATKLRRIVAAICCHVSYVVMLHRTPLWTAFSDVIDHIKLLAGIMVLGRDRGNRSKSR